MVALSFWLVILTLSLAGNRVADSYTVEENFEYINKVLDALNNNTECRLPTYGEIDELQKSFQELEGALGSSFENKLSDDQKLVRNTLLDQWTSFQERMTSFVVIRSAKKRSFLGKVEAYQKGKYNSSICTQLKDIKGPVTDRIFEKNPIVRYVKHLDTGNVPEPSTEPEGTDSEKETGVILTPIGEKDSEAQQLETNESLETTEGITIANVDEKMEEEVPATEDEKKEENYDPLADFPVPSAREEPETEVSTEFEITPTTIELQVGQDSYLEEASGDDVTIAEKPELVTVAEEESVTEEAPIETTKVAKIFDFGAEYVDDDIDDEDLKRLDKVVPLEWNIDPIYGDFKWPDEGPSDTDSTTDGSIKTEWKKFLENSELEESVEEERKGEEEEQQGPVEEQEHEEQPVTEAPEYIPRRLSPKELRRKRKELLDKISGDRRSREQDQLHGYSHAPEREHQEDKSDRWASVADNNFCKVSYNRDYMSKTRPIKAMKSLFGGSSGGTKKKAMMRSS